MQVTSSERIFEKMSVAADRNLTVKIPSAPTVKLDALD